MLVLLLTLLGTVLPALAAAAPEYRFRVPTSPVAGAPALEAQVLDDAQRAFIAGLPELRVAVPQPPSAPYETLDADGTVGGIHPDMLGALARTLGLRLKPVVMPDWSSTLQAARRGEVDILMTLGVTSERLEYLAFTLGATPLPGALFTRGGAAVDPARVRYAVERDYLADDWLRRQYPLAGRLTVETTADALRAVAEGRADAYLGSLLEAGESLRRQPQPGLAISRLVNYGTGYYHFAVRKELAPLAQILNTGIQTLRTNTVGELAEALAGRPLQPVVPALLPLGAAEATLLASRPVWTVGAVRGLEPLNGIDERGLHLGIAAEYTEQVARRLGVGLQVRAFESVAAMLDALRAGQIDLVPFLTRTPQRAEQFEFSTPYVSMPYMLVARSDDTLYWGLESLRGKRLALAAQHPLRETLARDHPEIAVVDAANGQAAMDAVVDGRADAAVEVKLFANQRIHQDARQRLRTVAEVGELPAQFHFAAMRGAASLLPLVDRALADIPPAEHQRMQRRWIAVDLPSPFRWQRHLPEIAVAAAALLMLAGLTVWWMRRLQREVVARRRSEQLLNDIATTMPGVAFRYVLNPDGSMRHHFFTPGARAFLGVDLEPDRTVVDTLAPRAPPEEAARARRLQRDSRASGEPFKITCPYAHPDGRQRWLHTEAVHSRSLSGHDVWTGYIVDVSTERELQARLAQEAESRNLMLASASHELRAPTHTLSLALQALPRHGLNTDQQRALQIAQGATHLLAELLNDVLDAARSQHEPLRLRPRTFDLHQLLEDLGGAWRSAAGTKGLDFALQIGPGVPRVVTLDGLRLRQVLTNLLSNACKYTPAGRVTLAATRLDAGALRFCVRDTGIGIAPAEQARVFQPFVTLDDPGVAPPLEGSSGLGLATCRRIAALMGGTITLDSEPGSGTQVAFTLPLDDAPADAAPQEGRIVVCDDDETSRLLMAHMLRREGFDIVETGDAAEALSLWRDGGIRAVVSDLDLPGMGGLELIRTLRAEEGRRGRPRTSVIVCSGSPVPVDEHWDRDTDFDAYIVKPVELGTLTETLRRLGVGASSAG